MSKANISFPDGMLEDVDVRAARRGTSRSAFVQEAIAHYVAALDAAAEHAAREERVGEALANMRTLGERLPPGDDGVTIIRRLRDAAPREAASEREDE